MLLLSLAPLTPTITATASNPAVSTGALSVLDLSAHMESFPSKASHVRALSMAPASVIC